MKTKAMMFAGFCSGCNSGNSTPSRGSGTRVSFDVAVEEQHDADREHELDQRFLDFAAMVGIGADAIIEKRRLKDALAKAGERIRRLEELLDSGERARAGTLGDLVAGLTSGALKVDRDVPLPDRLKMDP